MFDSGTAGDDFLSRMILQNSPIVQGFYMSFTTWFLTHSVSERPIMPKDTGTTKCYSEQIFSGPFFYKES